MSVLALLLGYLREGSLDGSNFSTYPRSGDFFTFTFNGTLYEIAVNESGQEFVPLGVTIQVVTEDAETLKIKSQRWDTTFRIAVNSHYPITGDSDARGIADLIDAALSACNCKFPISDYDASPPTPTGLEVTWQKFSRGFWRSELSPKKASATRKFTFDNTAFSGFAQLVLDLDAQYITPLP